MPDGQAAVDRLFSKDAIRDLLTRYCRAIDRKDDALLRSIYWPDAYDDHILFQGEIDGLVEYCMTFTKGMPTHHFIGNILIEFESADRAFGETYYQAYHLIDGQEADNRRDLILLGRYLDTIERRDGEWRIAQRICVVDAYTEQPATSDFVSGVLATAPHIGTARPADPLYAYNPAAL